MDKRHVKPKLFSYIKVLITKLAVYDRRSFQ